MPVSLNDVLLLFEIHFKHAFDHHKRYATLYGKEERLRSIKLIDRDFVCVDIKLVELVWHIYQYSLLQIRGDPSKEKPSHQVSDGG